MARKDRQQNAAAQRKWRAANRSKALLACRRWALMARYSLTMEAYGSMLVGQGGACAICRRPPKEKSLAVDHDHSTGVVRGLLCGPCNRIIGWLNDDAKLLRAAADYLEGRSR